MLLRWGDAIFADSPAFDLATLDGPAAEQQFGYNNDFTAFLPLPHGLSRTRITACWWSATNMSTPI